MADAFIGEIRTFAFGFVPQGWFVCNGQEISAPGNAALYAIIGNTWGGTPNQTFKLPNLQGLTVMSQGTGPGLSHRQWGATTVGAQSVTLTSQSQMPPHNHTLTMEVPSQATVTANTQTAPTANQSWLARGTMFATSGAKPALPAYIQNTGQQPDSYLHPATITSGGGNTAGGADAHENRQPYLTLVFCINNDGVFPVRN